jgi:preprotein translocase subunit SecG
VQNDAPRATHTTVLERRHEGQGKRSVYTRDGNNEANLSRFFFFFFFFFFILSFFFKLELTTRSKNVQTTTTKNQRALTDSNKQRRTGKQVEQKAHHHFLFLFELRRFEHRDTHGFDTEGTALQTTVD